MSKHVAVFAAFVGLLGVGALTHDEVAARPTGQAVHSFDPNDGGTDWGLAPLTVQHPSPQPER